MERRDTGITLIAIGKLLKVAALVTAGVLALTGDPSHSITRVASVLGIDPNGHHLHRVIAKVAHVDPHRLHRLGVGSFVYASLFLVEGLGLWFRKKWAEWLTLVITTSFVPLEIYELHRHPSAAKVVVLVLNVAAVVYLAVRRVRELRDRRFTQRHRPAEIPA